MKTYSHNRGRMVVLKSVALLTAAALVSGFSVQVQATGGGGTSITDWTLPTSQVNGMASSPGSLTDFDGRIFHAVRGTDNGIYTRSADKDSASDWSLWDHSGSTAGDIAMEVFDNKLYQAVRGTDNKVYVRRVDGDGATSEWLTTPGLIMSDIAMESFDGRLFQAAQGTDMGIYIRHSSNGVTWSDWVYSGTTSGELTFEEFDGKLFLVARGTDGGVYLRKNTGGTSWGDWMQTPGTVAGKVIMLNKSDSKLIQTARGTDNGIYTRYSTDGVSWSTWERSGLAASYINMAHFNGKIWQFARGTDNKFYVRSSEHGTDDWSAWSTPGSAVFSGIVADTFEDSNGKDVIWVVGSDNTNHLLPARVKES